MTPSGQEDQLPPPSLNERSRLGEATFAEMGGKEEHAPIPNIRGVSEHPRSFRTSAELRWDHHDSKQRMVGCREYNPVAQSNALDPPPGEDPAVAASGDQRRTAGT